MNDATSPISGLYFVTADCPQHGRTHADLARQAVAGGARVVQYREKARTARYLEAALAVREVCSEFGVLFIVNDDPELAKAVNADGLHLGQSDLHRLPGGGWDGRALLGISVSTVAEACRAVEQGASYLGVGPIFATPTKPDAAQPIGLEGLREIREAVKTPIAAIGGLHEGNAAAVAAAGADAICVVSAIALAANPTGAAKKLAEIVASAATARGGGAS